MKSWSRPTVPVLPGTSEAPCLYDTASGELVWAHTGDVARLYVCGITPYDATHMGHASTYLAFDTLQRVWLDAGLEVHYAQNVTDVDDPLLERAAATNVDWRDLAAEQVELFRTDMASLSILPPDDYVAVTEVIEPIADAVNTLLEKGAAYRVDTPDSSTGDDIYFDTQKAAELSPWHLGQETNLDLATMQRFFAERGGDPDRAGKRHTLDPLLWRAHREGEPTWSTAVGEGRPGWHIECSVIALDALGADFTVQGGGSDLVFPHHDLSAGHAAVLSGHPLARVFSHAGMVAYEGEKMSKSLGNLVLVSKLRAAGVDPRAIRLTILAHHYRSDWEWTDEALSAATQRLLSWMSAARRSRATSADSLAESRAIELLAPLRHALAGDLDTPAALTILDELFDSGEDAVVALAARASDALLGVSLEHANVPATTGAGLAV